MAKGTEMTRVEALEKAEAIVRNLEQAPINDRGYIRDGWKQPTFAERVQAVITMAEFILGISDGEDY